MKLFVAVLALLCNSAMAQSLPAFPGAMGGGAMTQGGRGGAVCEVTSTADSGSGTLRDCLLRSGPRILVYRVAGCFDVMSQILVSQPNVTILGQTAPGEVIFQCSKSTDGIRWSNRGQVIIRYVTWSPDNFNIPSGPDTGTLGFYVANTQAAAFITDHTTNRWAGNKPWLMYASWPGGGGTPIQYNKDTTMQWSLNYEPHAMHPVGPSTSELDTLSITLLSGNIDFIDNWFVNTGHRITEYNHSPIRWINNVTHNYGFYAYLGLGATQADLIGNVWMIANLQPQWRIPIHSTDGNKAGSLPGTPSFYISGNIGPDSTTVNANQYDDLARVAKDENVQAELGLFPASWRRSTPMPLSNTQAIPILPAVGLAQAQAPHIGNSRHLDCLGNWVSHRDPQDTRIVNQVIAKGPGGYWPNAQTQEGPSSIPPPTSDYQDHPVLTDPSGKPFPLCVESLHDGVPDQFKTAHGLSLTDPAAVNATDPATHWPYNEGYWGGLYDGGSTPIPPIPPNPTASPDGATCLAAGNVGCPLTDNGGNKFAFDGVDTTSTRGNLITKNGTVITTAGGTDAGKKLLWCAGGMYNQTNSGSWWEYNGTNFGVSVPGGPPTSCATTPPTTPTITGVTVSGPTSVVAGATATYTATVTGTGTYDHSVTWSANLGTITQAGVYTATPAASNDTITATSKADTTKLGRQSVTVTAAPPQPVCPTTGTVTIPYSLTINGVTVASTQACTWTLDVNTGILTLSACH